MATTNRVYVGEMFDLWHSVNLVTARCKMLIVVHGEQTTIEGI